MAKTPDNVIITNALTNQLQGRYLVNRPMTTTPIAYKTNISCVWPLNLRPKIEKATII